MRLGYKQSGPCAEERKAHVKDCKSQKDSTAYITQHLSIADTLHDLKFSLLSTLYAIHKHLPM
jgi:hypothetical protein